MVRFIHNDLLWLLALVPVILLLFAMARHVRGRRLKKYAAVGALAVLAPAKSAFKPWLRIMMLAVACALIVVALGGFQMGSKLEEVKREGVDIMVALDVSNSMMAEDIRPDRLERARQIITRLLDRAPNDRIGIVVFAGNAYVHLPITIDHSAAKLFLGSISSDMVPKQGTNIGTAIEMCVKSFSDSTYKHNAILLITDGEDHEQGGIDAAKEAGELGIAVHTIGMGSPGGVPIPLYSRGNKAGFLKDENGNTVLSKLNEKLLAQIAEAGGGIYVRATNSDDGLRAVLAAIDKMTKREFESQVYTEYEDRFQYLLLPAILLLLLEVLISDKKSGWWQRLDLFGESRKKTQR